MGNTYQVQQGDTLGAIAAKTNTTVADLARINNIADINTIQYEGPTSILKLSDTPQPPATPAQVPTYINALQDAKFADLALENSPFKNTATQTNEQISAEVNAAIKPTTTAPTPLDLNATYDSLRGQYNLDNIEKTVNDLTTQIDQENLNTMAQANLEKGKPVALNVIEGRITESSRIQNEKIAQLTLVRDSYVRAQTAAQNVISLRMSLTKDTYDMARQAYQDEFNQRLQTYNLIQTKEQTRDDLVYKIQQDERANANTNLQMYISLISKGQLNFNSLSSDEQLKIGKLEILAGLPTGFMASVKMEPGADIKSITTRTTGGQQYADIMRVGADGSVSVESKYIGTAIPLQTYTPKTPSAAEVKQSDLASASQELNSVKGADGFVSPDDFRSMMSEWQNAGYSRTDFLDNFAGLVNYRTNRPEYYGLTNTEISKYLKN